MNEVEQRLQQLTNAVLGGRPDEARQSTYAALARGSTANDILDALVEAANIVVDLHEVGEYDQNRLGTAESAVNLCLQAIEDKLAKSESKFSLKATVGPVGLKAGILLSLTLSAVLRSIGFRAISLGKTQTPLELLRNS
jgi:methanogenic corrinoid protein MtbC1